MQFVNLKKMVLKKTIDIRGTMESKLKKIDLTFKVFLNPYISRIENSQLSFDEVQKHFWHFVA